MTKEQYLSEMANIIYDMVVEGRQKIVGGNKAKVEKIIKETLKNQIDIILTMGKYEPKTD